MAEKGKEFATDLNSDENKSSNFILQA